MSFFNNIPSTKLGPLLETTWRAVLRSSIHCINVEAHLDKWAVAFSMKYIAPVVWKGKRRPVVFSTTLPLPVRANINSSGGSIKKPCLGLVLDLFPLPVDLLELHRIQVEVIKIYTWFVDCFLVWTLVPPMNSANWGILLLNPFGSCLW